MLCCFAPKELIDGALRPRPFPALNVCDAAIRREAENLDLGIDLGQLLPDEGIVGGRADVAQSAPSRIDQLIEANLGLNLQKRGGVESFKHQNGRGDVPAVIDRAQPSGPRHTHVVEKYLTKFCASGELTQWLYRHTGALHIDN